ncbi:ROK family protein [Streptomyces sp. NPDC091281]|uniref:ROK family protein n=1 Tax=Streptomyces sp. NPDC091281 TaxID=3365985 RepID=UPI00380EE934
MTIGIDLGGTGTRIVALDSTGTVRTSRSLPTRHSTDAAAEDLVSDLAAHIRDAAEGAALTAVGIGASGPVDPQGIIRNDATLRPYSHIPLTEMISARLGVPCLIDNDAVTAAIGENTYGAGHDSPALLMITLGTGVGVALLTHGTPYRSADGTHPEAGHIPVNGPPAPCYCGLSTCWEQLASRTALDAATGHTTAELAARAHSGELQARAVFERYGQHVGAGAGTLITVLRPAHVVIGGSAAQHLPLFAGGLQHALTRTEPFAYTPPVLPARLAEHSGAIGAAVLAQKSARQ